MVSHLKRWEFFLTFLDVTIDITLKRWYLIKCNQNSYNKNKYGGNHNEKL